VPRLDRLLQLLSTGSTPLVRQTAARQLGHIASIRIARVTHSHNVSSVKQAQAALSNATPNANPSQTYHGLDGEWEEIVNLLVKVLPFLRNKDWETRSAAALAIESILKAVGVWHPPEPNYQDPVHSLSSRNGNSAVKPEEYRPLAKFDLADIVFKGTKLLASSGNEFAGSAAANGKHDIVKAMGLAVPGAGDQDLGLDVEDELRQGQADEQKRQSPGVKGKGRAVDPVSASSSRAPAQADVDLSKLSARERNALKRKRKAGNAQGESSTAVSAPEPPQKVRLVAGSPSTSRSASPAAHAVSVKKEDADEESYGDGAQKMSQTVTIAYKGSQGGQAAVKAENQADEASAASWMPPPDQWPFSAIAIALRKDLLHQKWEYRHGACLGLRELIRTQGRAAGMSAGSSAEENCYTHALWCEDIAESILQVFALDRFGDFVGDHVVAPVRETASQTLSALLLNIPPELAYRITHVLVDMVAQTEIKKAKAEEGRKNYFWEVKHAGLLGLKYLAAVRQDMFTSMQSLHTQQPSLQTIVDAAVLGQVHFLSFSSKMSS
jgi:TATA-binding protein-associated factor